MINDIFKNIDNSIGVVSFEDDGAMWKRGRNITHVVNKMQPAVDIVKKWALKWGFRISVDKTKVMFFTRRNINQEFKIRIYSKELERIDHFKYLGIWFDKWSTWAVHIQKMIEKCKKVLNAMRCLRGVEWGQIGLH